MKRRPGHRRAPSTQIPDAPGVRHFRSRLGPKGGVIISDAHQLLVKVPRLAGTNVPFASRGHYYYYPSQTAAALASATATELVL